MKKYAYTINLVDDPALQKEYKERHDNIWPEVVNGLKSVGLVEMDIFQINRQLFMVICVEDDFDPAVGFVAYLETDPRCQQWEDDMDKYQEVLPTAKEGEKWSELTSIFKIR